LNKKLTQWETVSSLTAATAHRATDAQMDSQFFHLSWSNYINLGADCLQCFGSRCTFACGPAAATATHYLLL